MTTTSKKQTIFEPLLGLLILVFTFWGLFAGLNAGYQAIRNSGYEAGKAEMFAALEDNTKAMAAKDTALTKVSADMEKAIREKKAALAQAEAAVQKQGELQEQLNQLMIEKQIEHDVIAGLIRSVQQKQVGNRKFYARITDSFIEGFTFKSYGSSNYSNPTYRRLDYVRDSDGFIKDYVLDPIFSALPLP